MNSQTLTNTPKVPNMAENLVAEIAQNMEDSWLSNQLKTLAVKGNLVVWKHFPTPEEE